MNERHFANSLHRNRHIHSCTFVFQIIRGKMSLRRIKQEIKELEMESIPGCTAKPEHESNLYKWKATIKGPPESPYAGGIFHLTMRFPKEYPFKPPHIKFVTPIYHPNIAADGDICLDVLQMDWAPALTITKVLLSISSLMCDPNPNDPLEWDTAMLYKDDRAKYNETARNWTKKHAM